MNNKLYLSAQAELLYNHLKQYQMYKKSLEYWERKLKENNEKIKDLESVGAIRYDKQPSDNHVEQSTILNNLISEEMNILSHINDFKKELLDREKLCDRTQSQTQSYIRYILFDSHSWWECENEFYMSQTAIRYHIMKDLTEIVRADMES